MASSPATDEWRARLALDSPDGRCAPEYTQINRELYAAEPNSLLDTIGNEWQGDIPLQDDLLGAADPGGKVENVNSHAVSGRDSYGDYQAFSGPQSHQLPTNGEALGHIAPLRQPPQSSDDDNADLPEYVPSAGPCQLKNSTGHCRDRRGLLRTSHAIPTTSAVKGPDYAEACRWATHYIWAPALERQMLPTKLIRSMNLCHHRSTWGKVMAIFRTI